MNKSIAIFVLVIISAILLFRTCRKEPINGVDEIRIDTVFVGDTNTIYLTKYLTNREVVEIAITDTVRDTIRIKQVVTDYYSKFRYVDSIKDKDVVVRITDLISENRILERNYSVQNLRQSVFVTTTIPYQPRNKVFLGGGVTLSGEKIGYKANVFWMNKNDQLFGLGYNPPEGSVEFTAAFKIKLKR